VVIQELGLLPSFISASLEFFRSSHVGRREHRKLIPGSNMFLFFFLLIWDRVSLCSPGWSQTQNSPAWVTHVYRDSSLCPNTSLFTFLLVKNLVTLLIEYMSSSHVCVCMCC
jgi:hypothetical protein